MIVAAALNSARRYLLEMLSLAIHGLSVEGSVLAIRRKPYLVEPSLGGGIDVAKFDVC